MKPISTWLVAKRLSEWVSPWRRWVFLGILLSVVAALATAVWTSLVGPLLKSLLAEGQAQWGPLVLTREALVREVPLAIALVAAVKALSQFASALCLSRATQHALCAFRNELYERLLQRDTTFFESHHSGHLLSHFTHDLAQVELSFGAALQGLARDVFQILALLSVCLFIDARLFLVMFIVIPAGALPVRYFARTTKKAAQASRASITTLSTLAVEATSNVSVVQAFGAEPVFAENFAAEQRNYLRAMKQSLLSRAAFSPSTEFLGILGAAFAIGFGSWAVAREPGMASSLLSFLTASLMMYQPVKSLSNTFGQLSVGSISAQRLFEVFDAESTKPPTSAPLGASAVTPIPLAQGIEFKDVTLVFSDGRVGLKNVSFQVPRGHTVALVGESGAGKSSALALLLQQRVPTSGALLYDGVDFSQRSPQALRASMAWVSQEPVLFSRSVRDNLRWGRDMASDEALWTALEQASAAEFVRALPKQLDAHVGERGSTLSGGQRQRLALARAFLRAPQVLLLDEPTSALDAESERLVQEGLDALMKNRTVVLVAHRLRTVKNANEILVFSKGHIVERGTFESLKSQGQHFAQLLKTQGVL
jgi:ATP-binding cassette, subfamily B, bacterial MsbA